MMREVAETLYFDLGFAKIGRYPLEAGALDGDRREINVYSMLSPA